MSPEDTKLPGNVIYVCPKCGLPRVTAELMAEHLADEHMANVRGAVELRENARLDAEVQQPLKGEPEDVLDTVADLIDRLDQAEARERALVGENERLREALGRGAEALADAIAHNVNAIAEDSAGWTQEDYDEWDAALAQSKTALNPSGND